ncbi:MAG: DUF1847 domain-containing protein [Thermodesulfobacteriota bacterium]
MPTPDYPTCASCPHDWSIRFCRTGKGKAPANCPSIRMRELSDHAREATASQENHDFARLASVQEAEGYGGRDQGYAAVRAVKPRIVEIIEFARRMGYRRLGLAFCIGLRKEAAVVQEIFETNGFATASVACKAGAVSKSVIGIGPCAQVDPGAEHESMCNPVFQAEALNAARSEFNVLLGLCVGHDSLFLKYAGAPCTVLAVKDRMLGHNPLAAVQQYDGYYRYLKRPLD